MEAINFKYNIYINQWAVIVNGFNLDIIDVAIFDYIKDFSNVKDCERITTGGETYFFIKTQKIIDDMPLLNISTTRGIRNRIDKLIDSGLLIRHPECQQLGRTYYKFGPNYDKMLFFPTQEKNFQGVGKEFPGGRNENSNNNNIIDNKINDNNNPPLLPSEVPPKGKSKESGKTELDFSIVKPEFGNVVLKWLAYKKERKQTYKQMGFNSFYKKLIKLSGGDPIVADMIVEQSMANNYQGIFELKEGNNYGNSTNKPTESQLLGEAIRQSWGPDGDPLADILR
jgi:hypothetical protein